MYFYFNLKTKNNICEDYSLGLRCYEDDIFGLYKKDKDPCDLIIGIDEKQNADFTIQPNPFDENIEFRFDDLENNDYDYFLTNSLGQEIKSGKLKRNMDFSEISTGVYLIKLYNRNTKEIRFKKLIKN